jgi:hypothetical protein
MFTKLRLYRDGTIKRDITTKQHLDIYILFHERYSLLFHYMCVYAIYRNPDN